jgi:hypothetical protein
MTRITRNSIVSAAERAISVASVPGGAVNFVIADRRERAVRDLGVTISASDAWDIIDHIIARIGDRPKRTARDVWDELPEGAVIGIVHSDLWAQLNGDDHYVKLAGGNVYRVRGGRLETVYDHFLRTLTENEIAIIHPKGE